MVHIDVVRPRYETVLAPPVTPASQNVLIAAVWLGSMALPLGDATMTAIETR